jgi:hypothetical protein
MLKKLDETTKNRLRVAEYLQKLNSEEFHMHFCSNCICGHINRAFLGFEHSAGTWGEQRSRAAEFLGISNTEADKLFSPGNPVHSRGQSPHPQDAARVMRYLAATDTVDWRVA